MNHTRQARWGALLLTLIIACSACIEVQPLGAARPAPDAPADMPDLSADDQTPDAPLEPPDHPEDLTDDGGDLDDPDLTDMMPDLSHCYAPRGADMAEDMWGDMASDMGAEDMGAEDMAPSMPYVPCKLGAVECDGVEGVRTCVEDERGCPHFGPAAPCGPESVCVGGACRCTELCKDNEVRCKNNTSSEICFESSGACPQWFPRADCDEETSCFLGECACPNNCNLGETRCTGRELQRCDTLGNCRGWVTVRTCTPGRERCDTSSPGNAQCVSCEVRCNPGARFCHQESVSRCELAGDNECPIAVPNSQCHPGGCWFSCIGSCTRCGGCSYCP